MLAMVTIQNMENGMGKMEFLGVQFLSRGVQIKQIFQRQLLIRRQVVIQE